MAQLPINVELDRKNRKNLVSNITELFNKLRSLGISIDNIIIQEDENGNGYLEIRQARGESETLNGRLVKIEDDLNNIGDFSPHRAFNTLKELENYYPDGSEGIMVVKSDNSWYFWNGTVWDKGGIYQAKNFDDYLAQEGERW